VLEYATSPELEMLHGISFQRPNPHVHKLDGESMWATVPLSEVVHLGKRESSEAVSPTAYSIV
jgi:hypothetical protein